METIYRKVGVNELPKTEGDYFCFLKIKPLQIVSYFDGKKFKHTYASEITHWLEEKEIDSDALTEDELLAEYSKNIKEFLKIRKKPFSLFPTENFCTCVKPWTVSGICRVCEKPFKNKK